MARFDFTVKVLRTIEETFDVVVEADNAELALDLTEDAVEVWPEAGDRSNVRYLMRTSITNWDVEIVDAIPEDFD